MRAGILSAGEYHSAQVRVVNGWSNLKTKFDKSVDSGVPWIRDEPRSARHTDPRHTEKLLNHVSGFLAWRATIVTPAWTRCVRPSPMEKRVSEIVALN
jgi:hypothetical protein